MEPKNKRKDITDEQCNYLYNNLEWSLNEIAQHFSCSHSTIKKHINKRRTIKEAVLLGYKNNKIPLPKMSNFKKLKYNGIIFKSSWEIEYAKLFDEMNIIYKYEKKRFDLGDTTYTPDFYLPKHDLYIEVKGYEREDFFKKIELLKIKYPNIKIYVVKGISEFHKLFVLQFIFGSKFTNFSTPTTKERETETQKYYVYLLSELNELIRETNFKEWKQKKDINYSRLYDELADIWHFMIAISLIWDIQPNEIEKIYKIKNKENHKRQKEGY